MNRWVFFLAIGQLMAQPQVDYVRQVQRTPAVDIRTYRFTLTPTQGVTLGNLATAGVKTLTVRPCPVGVSGTDSDHYLYISGGVGTAESVLITGGSCTSGAVAGGTLIFTTAHTHTADWQLTSATSGLQEALLAVPGRDIDLTDAMDLQAPTKIPVALQMRGLGIGKSVFTCSALLTAPAFTVTGTATGFGFSDFTVDMTACGSQDTFSLTAQTIRPYFERIEITYPTDGTGKAFYTEGPGELHMLNTIITNSGYCVDIQGDNAGGPGTEYFFDNVICDSPGSWGFRISRTAATDVGGYYLKAFKITNPQSRENGGFQLTSTVANTPSVFFCVQCVADNIKGFPALDINNHAALHFVESWFTSGVLDYAAGHSAIRVRGTTTEVNFVDIQAQGHADGLLLDENATSIRWIAGKLSGVDLACAAPGSGASCAIRVGSSAVLNNIDIRASIIDEFPMTAVDQQKLLLSGQQPITFVAAKVYTLNNQGLAQTFCIVDATVGADPTGIKCLGINHLGWFEMRNSNNDDIFVVTDDGIPVFPETDHMVIGGPTANTTLTFPTPVSSIGLTFPDTGGTIDTTAGSVTGTVVVKGSAGANCNLVFTNGRLMSTTCP